MKRYEIEKKLEEHDTEDRIYDAENVELVIVKEPVAKRRIYIRIPNVKKKTLVVEFEKSLDIDKWLGEVLPLLSQVELKEIR